MLNPIDLGIALGLARVAEDAAMRLSAALARRVELESRLGPGYLPHVTLFQGRFPGSAERGVNRRFSRLAEQSSSTEIQTLRHLALSMAGNVFWPVAVTSGLRSLHLRACYAFRPVTGGLLLPLFSDMMADPRLERARIERFGFPSAGESFAPHITLCRLARPRLERGIVEQISAPALRFSAQELLLARLGPAGNFLEVVSRAALRT